jgi:tRNA 2-selenouridine synthase
MSVVLLTAAEAAARLAEFHAVIDARSPAEFAEDHLPGAINWPVLDDAQRRVVGTEYKQVSSFDARKIGAAMVARNIADHLDRWAADKPRDWQPLVYCWRGGERSGTLAWFLGKIGFRTHLVQGGYKAFRAVVREQLDTWPRQIDWRVVCGRTGSGKTRLLHALAAAGAQVLDLERHAKHRGSVLGLAPGDVQPGQKAFERMVWTELRGYDLTRPVYVESESRKIGQLRVPELLLDEARARGRCLHVELDDKARLQLLLEDYAYLGQDPQRFCSLLDALRELRGKDQVASWQAAVQAGDIATVFGELMHKHYDPGYLRSLAQTFAGFEQAEIVTLADATPEHLAAVARRLIEA